MEAIDHRFWLNGPKPGDIYHFPGNGAPQTSYNDATQRTLAPMVTSTSVLGIVFDGGVMICGDILGSYGSLARYRNCSRLMKVNDTTILGASGDYADYQFVKGIIEQRVRDDECLDDGFEYSPGKLFAWLTRVMYNRRSKFNPLWNNFLIGGLQDGKPFLGSIDKIGTAYTETAVASGFGSYMALPMMRSALEKKPNLSEAEARKLLDDCMRVLFYRDARSFYKYELAIVTKDGAKVEGPIQLESNWEIAHAIKTNLK